MLHSFYDYLVGDKDFSRSFRQISEKNGFHFESHPVITEDGYINQIYRIRKNEFQDRNMPAVLMMHGLCDKADTWIKHYPEVAPAFVLAREGYDVWLGNNRGTDPSYKHLEYDPVNDGKKYWNFSWYELG